MTLRVLFFPWGHGAAYTARCVLLANELAAAGDEVAFSGCGASNLVRAAGLPLLPRSTPSPRERQDGFVPLYLPFGSVERVFAAGARYYREDVFAGQLEEDISAIETFGPDIVVIDMWPTAALAARAAGIPLVSLADVDFLSPSANAWMPWCEVPELVLPFPSCLPVLDQASRKLGLGPVSNASDLLWGDTTLIASVPELEPLPPGAGPNLAHYVGPLWWDPPDAVFEPSSREGLRVYVTVGSGGSVRREVLQTLVDSCAEQPWNVFMSVGYDFSSRLVAPNNVTFGGFTGLDRPLQWADVVIGHGGSSTTLATLYHGKPSVILPFMSETEMNGRQLVEAQGAGVLLRRTVIDQTTGKITFINRHSGESPDGVITPKDVRQSIDEVTSSPTVRAAAARVSAPLRRAVSDRDLVSPIHALAATG
jgi:UDP:flavonoid glycosyltransferase YjiC (YdhE family)